MPGYDLTDFAISQLRDATAWYERERDGLSGELLDDVEATLAFICEQPLASPNAGLRGVRRRRCARFSYAIYYRLAADERVVVLSVYHTARRPHRWRGA